MIAGQFGGVGGILEGTGGRPQFLIRLRPTVEIMETEEGIDVVLLR